MFCKDFLANAPVWLRLVRDRRVATSGSVGAIDPAWTPSPAGLIGICFLALFFSSACEHVLGLHHTNPRPEPAAIPESAGSDASSPDKSDARSEAEDTSKPFQEARAEEDGVALVVSSETEVDDGRGDSGGKVDGQADPLVECENQVRASWDAGRPSLGFSSGSSFGTPYDEAITKLMDDHEIPGAALAVADTGTLVLAKGYGFAEKDSPVPKLVHPDSLFRTITLSQAVTSAGILLLVKRGVLSLDEKAFRILDNIKPLAGKSINPKTLDISVRDLLRHTGGWNSSVGTDVMFGMVDIAKEANLPLPLDCKSIARWMIAQPLQYEPGEVRCFSDFGYCLLGQIITAKTGVPYEEWIRDNVFGPVGVALAPVGRGLATGRASDEVVYYDYNDSNRLSAFDGRSLVPAPYGSFSLESMVASAGWLMSPVDILRFQVGLEGRGALTPALLDDAQLQELRADPGVRVCTPSGGTLLPEPDWYGLGWMIETHDHWSVFGAAPGSVAWQSRRSNGYGWAVSFNKSPANLQKFKADLDAALLKAAASAGAHIYADWSDQYLSDFTAWLPESEYRSFETNRVVYAKEYPIRIEGKLDHGEHRFRGKFAKKHWNFEQVRAVDCNEYRERDKQWRREGYSPVSLQAFIGNKGRMLFQAVWVRE